MISEELKKRVNNLKQKYIDIRRLWKLEKKTLKQLKVQLNDIIQTQLIGQEAAEQIQKQVHKRISKIVNKCLQAIFPNPYKFKIRFTRKRRKTEADLLFIRNGREIKNIGGGVIVIVAFALRLSSILLSKKEIAPLLLLDQAFSGDVSKDKGYLKRVPKMVVMLAEEYGIQFIQVTHEDMLKMGKIIKVK